MQRDGGRVVYLSYDCFRQASNRLTKPIVIVLQYGWSSAVQLATAFCNAAVV